MAAGVPVVASATGALTELVGAAATVPPGDPEALAAAAAARFGDAAAGEAGLRRVRALTAPEALAPSLEALYH